MSDPTPEHDWNGDDLGHDCADCDYMSIWRCDKAVHDDYPYRMAIEILGAEGFVALLMALREREG